MPLVVRKFETFVVVAPLALLRVTLEDTEHSGGKPVTGVGQFSQKDGDLAVEVFHRHVGPALIGHEVSLAWMDTLTDVVLAFELNYKMMGTFLNKAVAACDLALLDALAKHQGVLVHELWAPHASTQVRAYASSLSRDVASSVLATKLGDVQRDWGVAHFKIKLGTRMAAAAAPPKDVDVLLLNVRRAVGPAARVAVDCNGAFASGDVALASVHGHDVWFIEEPVPWYTAGLRRAFARETPPLWGGEQEFRADAWAHAIAHRVFDCVQPDVGYCGGPSLARRICVEALNAGLGASAHSPQGDMHAVYAWHVLRSLPVREAFLELACVDDGLAQITFDSQGCWRPALASKGGLRMRHGGLVDIDAAAMGWGVVVDEAQWLPAPLARTCDGLAVRGPFL